MSRNFELMQQLEWEEEHSAFEIREENLLANENRAKSANDEQWASDEALKLAHRVFLLQTQGTPRVAVFAGVDHNSGCSHICVSVAEALARNTPGLVCLLEANFRSPGLPSLLNTRNHYGFTDALLGRGPIGSFAKSVGPDKLRLISTGTLTAGSSRLLADRLVGPKLAELRAGFDFVIIDAQPLLQYADAIALARPSDGVVLVLEAESTRRKAALRVVEKLRISNVPILGAVLNKRIFPIPERIDGRL